MDVREKLVELLYEADKNCNNKQCETCRHQSKKFFCKIHFYIDHLIAHGVTVQENCKSCAEATQNCIVKLQEQIAELRSVQEWIPVKDRLPEKTGKYLVYGRCFGNKAPQIWICECICIGSVMGWCNNAKNPVVEAWTTLPQPPKGE